MPSRVTLSAHGLQFVIRLERFEFDLAPGMFPEDADWIIGDVELEVGRYRGAESVTARASELESFRRELAALLETMTGKAELTHLEEQFQITIELRNGNGEISGFVSQHIGARLTFDEIKIDQSFLAPTLNDLTHALQEFPMRTP